MSSPGRGPPYWWVPVDTTGSRGTFDGEDFTSPGPGPRGILVLRSGDARLSPGASSFSGTTREVGERT